MGGRWWVQGRAGLVGAEPPTRLVGAEPPTRPACLLACCPLQEIGPRFTLKLQSLQKGTFDSKGGEFEWVHKPDVQETSRRKFQL